MADIILLTGEPRVGKTTTLIKIINMLGEDNCGGFYTEEVRKEGKRIGFNCVDINGNSKRISDISFKSNFKVGRYGVKLDDFEEISLKSISRAVAEKEFIIIDEIGPMQVLSQQFLDTLEILFGNNKTIIGTIFYGEHPEINRIKEKDKLTIIDVTKENRDSLPQEIYSMILN